MAGIRHPEFIAELENTKYPFTASSTLTNGIDSLLEGTLLDAHIYAVEGSFRYYLSSVVVTSDSITINLGDSELSDRLKATISLPITNGIVQLEDVYGRPGGTLVSDPVRLSLLSAWGLGTHTFRQKQTEFCVTCQVPVPNAGVTAIRIPSGELLYGKVWLLGEDGVILKSKQTTDPAGNVVELIEINVVGDPLFLQRLCNPQTLFSPVNPIRTIRVEEGSYTYDCTPDDQGNFSIQMNDALASDAALRVRTSNNSIVFSVEGTTNAAGTA